MSSSSNKKLLFPKIGGRIVKFKKTHLNDPQVVEMGRRSREMLEKVDFPELPEKKNKS